MYMYLLLGEAKLLFCNKDEQQNGKKKKKKKDLVFKEAHFIIKECISFSYSANSSDYIIFHVLNS